MRVEPGMTEPVKTQVSGQMWNKPRHAWLLLAATAFGTLLGSAGSTVFRLGTQVQGGDGITAGGNVTLKEDSHARLAEWAGRVNTQVFLTTSQLRNSAKNLALSGVLHGAPDDTAEAAMALVSERFTMIQSDIANAFYGLNSELGPEIGNQECSRDILSRLAVVRQLIAAPDPTGLQVDKVVQEIFSILLDTETCLRLLIDSEYNKRLVQLDRKD